MYNLVYGIQCSMRGIADMNLDEFSKQYRNKVESVSYHRMDTAYESVLCQPKEPGKYPAVITIHGIFGLQEMDVRFASRLSAEGYVVLAHGWQSKEQDPADEDIVKGIESALDFLKQNERVDAERISLIGVCRGGSITMVTGAYVPAFRVLVSFYGQSYYPFPSEKKPYSPIDLVDNIQSPMLIIHGEEDTIFSVQESMDYCHKLEMKGKVHQCKFYPEAEHGFFLEGHRNYHRQASEDAWMLLKKFLRDALSLEK